MAHVLIVDDERAVRELIRRWVSNAGHDARDVESAEAALAALAEESADVMLCDVHLPGANGLWLTGQVRNTYALTAVVLSTGSAGIAQAGIRMRAGVLAYLIKPFRHDALVNALDTAIAWHDGAQTAGPRADDRGDRLQRWLDELKNL